MAGGVWQGGVHGRGTCMAGGACAVGETVTAVDGMHPTGMHYWHYCYVSVSTSAEMVRNCCAICYA